MNSSEKLLLHSTKVLISDSNRSVVLFLILLRVCFIEQIFHKSRGGIAYSNVAQWGVEADH